jgi:hypothetical protein
VFAGFKLRRGTHPAVLQQSLLQPDFLTIELDRKSSGCAENANRGETRIFDVVSACVGAGDS